MPGPQAPEALLSTEEFARRLRQKAAAGNQGTDPYAHLSDEDLTHRVVTNYPVYKSKVIDLGAGMEGIQPFGPPPTPKYKGRPTTPADLEHQGMTSAMRGVEDQITDQMLPPNPMFGPLGVVASALSPTAQDVMNVPVRGGVQLIHGAAKVATAAPAGPLSVAAGVTSPLGKSGAADMIEGGMGLGTLAIAPALAAAPVPTLAGILLGTAGQYGMRKAAPALGLEGDDARLAEDVAGVAAGAIGSVAAGGLQSLNAKRIASASDRAAVLKGQLRGPNDLVGPPGSASRVPFRVWDAEAQARIGDLHREPIYQTIVDNPSVTAGAAGGPLSRSPQTHLDLTDVATPPPEAAAIAETARSVQATPAARPRLKDFARTLEDVKAGRIDPADQTRSAYERAAAAVFQRTGTLTIEDVQKLHARYKDVGTTLGQVAQQADTIGQAPPRATILGQPVVDPQRLLPPVGTSVVGGSEQTVLDPTMQARLDQPPRFIALDPGASPLRYDFLNGQIGVGTTPPEFPPDIETLGALLESELGSPPPMGQQGRLVPEDPNVLRLRREQPAAPSAGEPQLPGVAQRKGRQGKPKVGEPPPSRFEQGLSPTGISEGGQYGLPIDPRYREPIGQIVQRRNKSPQAFEAGVYETPYHSVKPEELIEVGKMLTAMEAQDYTPATPRTAERADKLGREFTGEWLEGAAGHPVYYDIVGGSADMGPMYKGYSRAEVTAKLRMFLEHGKRSLISDLAVDAARRAQETVSSEVGGMRFEGKRGHAAQDVPEEYGRQAARFREGPGFEPLVREHQTPGGQQDALRYDQGPGGPPAAAEDLPAWVTDQTTYPDEPGAYADAGQQATEIGQPPPSATQRANAETPGRVAPGLEPPDILSEARDRNARRGATFTLDVVPPVDPVTTKAFKRWLNRKRADHFTEPWFEAATDALAEGNALKAWRIAAMVSGEDPTTPGGAMRANQVGQPPPAARLRATPGGAPLPPRTTVGPGGLLVPPELVRQLDPKFTDLLAGHALIRPVLENVDHLAADVVLREGGSAANPKELRLNRQVVSGMLEEAQMGTGELKKLSKLLKLRPEEVARHLMRQASQAGKILNMWSQYYTRNIDDLTFLEGLGVDTSGLDAEGIKAMARKAELDPAVRQRRLAAERVADTARAMGILVDGSKGRGLAKIDQIQFANALSGHRNRVYMGLLNDVENFSRALIVSQPVTGIRNLWTQAARYYVGALDQALSAPFAALGGDLKAAKAHLTTAEEMLKGPFRPGSVVTPNRAIHSTMQAVFDYTMESVKGLPAKDVRKTLALLDQYPIHAMEFMGATAGDLAPGVTSEQAGVKGTVARGLAKLASPKVRQVLTALNRSAEYSQRSVIFDSLVRAGLRNEGIDPNILLVEDPAVVLKRLGQKGEDLIVGATHAALDYTFASKPLKGSIPGRLLTLFNEIPVVSPLLRTAYPFPRFNLIAAPRFIFDHSPAALIDILRIPVFDMWTGPNAPKGRLWRGMAAANIEHEALPKMEFAVRQAEAKHGAALQDWAAARQAAAKSASKLKALEKRAARAGTLEGMTEDYQRVVEGLQGELSARDAARFRAGAAKHEWQDLAKKRVQLQKQVREAKQIGAPTFHEWAARQTAGLALLGAAYALRDSEGAKGTQWYEYRVGKRTIDFRPFAPFVQYLLVADWMKDLHDQTDWHAVRTDAAGNHNPLDWAQSVKKHYSGKYTGQTFGKQLAQAFISMSQAAGTTLSISDFITGDAATGDWIDKIYNSILGSMGQFLGRFTTPLQTINDITGQFSEEDRKARIPEEPVEGDRKSWEQLTGPTVAKIPGLRREIPEKINPMTGQPIATVDPLGRQFAGVTQRERSIYEQELARVGLPWYKATPRQVGDRDFDNEVAKGYHQGLEKFMPRLLHNKRYLAMPTDLQRELLQGVMSDIKGYAYQQVAKQIGVKATHEKLEKPSAKDRIERWKAYLKTLKTELSQERPAVPETGDQVGAPPPGPGG